MKNLLSALVGLLLIGRVHANEVAIVDFKAALLQSNIGQKEAVEPKKKVAALNARLKKEQEALQKMGNDLKRDELTLSSEDLAKRRIALAQRQNHVHNMAAGMQDEAKQLEQKLINSLTPKMEAALKSMIKERKLDLVLNSELSVYAKADADITKELIDRINTYY